MHRSHLPLRKWFLAIFLITHDKRGYSAMQLAHELKVTRKTAGYLLQRIRGAMALQVIPNVMSGIIELDDAYIGSKGKTRGRGTEKVSFDLYRFFGHKITRFLFENPVVFPISSEGAIP